MRGRIAVCVAIALITGCTSNAPAKPAAPARPPRPASAPGTTIHWTSCKGSSGPSGYQCASIAVPRDPHNPSLGTIQMALDRKPASGKKIGSLLVNPGGPGASGVDFLADAVSLMPSALLSRFDVVGFDPPGVDRTAPVFCLDSNGLEKYFDTDPDPTTAAGLNTVIAEDRTFASGCLARSSSELPYASTVDAAMDMDVVRQDVGDAKLTYFGFSYGTFLGATYADMYPTRVRAMVLDGAIDPSVGVVPSLDRQSASIEQELNQVFASCSSNRSCAWKPGGNLLAAYESLMQRVRTKPIAVPGTSQRVGPAELLYGTVLTLYSPSSWVDLEKALAQLSQGNGSFMLQLFNAYVGRQPNGSYSNELEANTAVNCLDAPSPSISTIESDAPTAAAAAPVFGVADLYSELQCAVWPVPATGAPGEIHAAGSPAILVIGSTGDPATPYSEAVSLAHQLDQGVLLTRVGEGHTGYQFSSCVRSIADSYLVDLTVPAAGTRCPTN